MNLNHDMIRDLPPKNKTVIKFNKNTFVLLILAGIVCFVLFIFLIPLNGVTGNELNTYDLYPIEEINLHNLQSITDEMNHIITFTYQWTESNFLQPAAVEITCELSDDGSYIISSSKQINSYCKSPFFKQVGGSVNIIDDIVFIQISGYRKILFISGRAETFGFAIKITE